MNVPTLEMPTETASAKAQEYAAAVRANTYPNTLDGRRQRSIDAAAAKGFKAIASGKTVINVHTALSYAGLYTDGPERGLPRLAIARADATRVRYQIHSSNTPRARFTFEAEFATGSCYNRRGRELSFQNLAWNYELASAPFTSSRWNWRAIVPIIPPSVRPKWCRLRSRFILWEANWERAPADPFLLTHIASDLYTIDAQWDLTELERGLLEHSLLQL